LGARPQATEEEAMSDQSTRAVAYVRVSSKRQAEEGLSLEDQQRRVESYIAAREWDHVHTHVERGVSGTVAFEDRPEFGRLLDDLAGIDKLVIPKLDRLGRSTKELLAVFERLEQAGVAVVSLSENIDTGTPVGRLLRTVLAAVAEFERDRISERIADTNEAKARSGKRSNAPRPLGYDKVKGTGELVENRAEAAVVRRIYAEFTGGKSQRQIAIELNAEGITAQRGGTWQQASISQILANPIYSGQVTYKGEAFDGNHDAIVSREQWAEAAQLRQALARTVGKGRRPAGSALLTRGMLRCGLCGEPMTPVTKPTRTPGQRYEVYQCLGRIRRLPFDHGWPEGFTLDGEGPPAICPQRPIKRALVDTAIWRFFADVGLDLDATRAAISETQDLKRSELRALRDQAEREAQKAEDRLARVRRDYQDGRLDADDWNEQRPQLTGELEAARSEADRHARREGDLEAEIAAIDTEAAVLAELSTIRALVAGQAQQRSREGIDAFRAALLRLFERFELVTHPLVVFDGEPVHCHSALSLPEDATGEPRQWLRPYVRPDAIAGWDSEAAFPALRRAALALSAAYEDSASPSCMPSCSVACEPCCGALRAAAVRGFSASVI